MTGIDGWGDGREDRGLRSLAAAVDAGSLTAAAAALGVGQPAVSHSVRRLEERLGVTLLDRGRLGVSPTPAGAELLAVIGPAFRAIDDAVARAAAGGDDPTVSLSVSTSLAAWWLLPRLPRFKQRHPDVPLRLVTTDSDADTFPAGIELWIPLGIIERSDVVRTELCAEALVPVAAPRVAAEFVSGSGPLDPARLLDAPLLHLEERYRPRFDWGRWFALHDVAPTTPLAGDRSNDYSLVLQAALDGQGVALGWRHIVADLLATHRLVPLAEPVITDQPFEIVHRADRELSTGARALRDWLVESMQGSTDG